MKYAGILHDAQQGYQVLLRAWEFAKPLLLAGHKLSIKVGPVTRSLEANAKMWAMLTDVSRQVVWHGMNLSPEDFKNIFTAALKKTRVCPGIDGGFVVLGQSTSQMSGAEMSELMALISAFGDERGIKWSEPDA